MLRRTCNVFIGTSYPARRPAVLSLRFASSDSSRSQQQEDVNRYEAKDKASALSNASLPEDRPEGEEVKTAASTIDSQSAKQLQREETDGARETGLLASSREARVQGATAAQNVMHRLHQLLGDHSNTREKKLEKIIRQRQSLLKSEADFTSFVADQEAAAVKVDQEFPERTWGISSRSKDIWLDVLGSSHRDDKGKERDSQKIPLSHRMPFYKRHVEGMLTSPQGERLEDVKPAADSNLIPILRHGLHRALSNPGVHWLQEPRTGIWNFSRDLKKIPDVEQFAFERVAGFVSSSRDNELLDLAKQHECSFAGSTSSLTGMLSQIYLLISNGKNVDTSVLSAPFQREPRTFTPGQRMPISVTLWYRDGVYATDTDTGHLGKTETILSQLGIVLERFFTTPSDDFRETLMRRTPVPLPHDHALPQERYRYAKFGKFIMRAQLDCHSRLLPGSGVFDIKTRAAMPIRYDLPNYKSYTDYTIRTIQGPFESFEKEYYDLIRSAFLKYSFQVRIGDMDGVFVAYHNTDEIFGFQYISLEEMDMRLFGHTAGNRVFHKCISLMDKIFAEIVQYFPEQSVNCTWETSMSGNVMRVWIEPQDWPAGVPKPLVQLDIKVDNYLDMEKVPGSVAVGSASRTWTVHYTITKSTLSQEAIRAKRRAAFDRQLLIYKYGLNLNEKAERRQDIDLTHVAPLAEADPLSLSDILKVRLHPSMLSDESDGEGHVENKRSPSGAEAEADRQPPTEEQSVPDRSDGGDAEPQGTALPASRQEEAAVPDGSREDIAEPPAGAPSPGNSQSAEVKDKTR